MRIKLLLTAALALSFICCARYAGDPEIERGRTAIGRYGCGSCHIIPGIAGARGLVGPSLEHVASRVYLAGVLQNTPYNMIRWIRGPQAVDRLTAMPNLGVTEQDATAIMRFLYTLP